MFNEKMKVYAAKTQPEVINVESQSQETQSQGIIEETQLISPSHKENESVDKEVNKSLSLVVCWY